jgi:2-iminobutanoate/2-iminopropanoate deaminase
VIFVIFLIIAEVVSSFTNGRSFSRIQRRGKDVQTSQAIRRFQPLSAELRLLIQGTKNAYTTARAGDVLSYLLEGNVHGKKNIRLGALTENGQIAPLCNRIEGGAEFYYDHTSPTLSAEKLKEENRLCRVISSDRRNNAFIIDEYLDDSYVIPVIGGTCDVEDRQVDSDMELAQLELKLAQKKVELLEMKQQIAALSAIKSSNAPNPVGPYSQAIKVNGMVFASGCIGLDPQTGKLVEGGIETETIQSLKNLQAILKEAGTDINKIAKTTIFVTDLKQYALVNKIYAEYLKDNKVFPARTTVEVSGLPLGAKVEIEAVAFYQ